MSLARLLVSHGNIKFKVINSFIDDIFEIIKVIEWMSLDWKSAVAYNHTKPNQYNYRTDVDPCHYL